MSSTRFEILSNGTWKRLVLRESGSVKYNKLINKIGSLNSRQISHSNTLSLPSIHDNIQALGINLFNHLDLAKALNSKYPCKYYVDEKLFQEGFLVINNTNFDEIRANFIDASLSIIETWTNTTYKNLLLDPTLNRPADYQDAIDEMKGYFLDKSNPISTYLGEVGVRGYNLSLFPNNLNVIGEKFQINKSGIRPDNTFNPYQSRPVFNAKSVFDLACETYGYTPIFDESIDWDKIAGKYIVPEGMAESSDNNTSEVQYAPVAVYPDLKTSSVVRWVLTSEPVPGTTNLFCIITDGASKKAIKPNEIAGWYHQSIDFSDDYLDLNCVFIPDLFNSPNGAIKFRVVGAETSVFNPRPYIGFSSSVWSNETPGGNVIFQPLTFQNYVLGSGEFSFEVNKTQLQIKPAGASELIGVFVGYNEWRDLGIIETKVTQTVISETFLDLSVMAYDEWGQYVGEELDLTYAAPNKSVLDLLKGLMNHEGILININEKDKKITFFNYSTYNRNREDGLFSDWSKYLRESTPFLYNTDYGSEYAEVNNIGLQEPFPGNTFNVVLNFQAATSKYKKYTTNHSSLFKDVSSISDLKHSITPYIEYENLGLGLVELTGLLGDLSQVDANDTAIGTISSLPALANINYAELPLGIQSWYRLVDVAVRANPTLLLPIEVVKNIDLSEPIYLGKMNGFWIIEEVSEYENSQTQVEVKLIRLVDDAEFNSDFNFSFKT